LASGASKVTPSPSEMKQVSKQVTQHSTASCKSKRAAEVIERLEGLKKKKNLQAMSTCNRQLKVEAIEMLARARAVEAEAEKKLQDVLLKENMMEKATSGLAEINQQVEQRKQVLAAYEKEIKKKREINRYYNQVSNNTSSDDITKLIEVIEGALIHLKGKHNCTKAKLLMEAIISGRLFNGEAANLLQKKIRNYIQNLFRPWKLVKAADVAAVGAFKSSTINALRSVIDEQNEELFPSNSTVSRVRGLLDEYGFEKIGWERRMTRFGEVFFINFEKALRLLLKACQLEELATRAAVKVALTVDGADLFRGRTHVSTGIKVTDERGVHPVTKQPFCVVNDENDEVHFVKVQSSEVCCIMIIADAVDSKEIYSDVFREYYDWGERLRKDGLAESELGPKLMPLEVLYCNDLKGTWYLTCKGGGCKNKTYFCHLCACTKDTLTDYKIGNDRCARCLTSGRLKCYHHNVCDSVSVRQLLTDLDSQLGVYYEKHGKRYQDIISRSRLLTNHMQGNKESDELHIDFVVPPMDDEKQKQYANFIARECIIRGLRIDARDNFEVWRSMLRESVALEKYICFLEHIRKWNEGGHDKVPLIEVLELLIPCILHLENRVGEKLITAILRKALDLQDLASKEEFIQELQRTLQTKIFGTENAPSQWKLRYDKEAGTGTISLESIQLRNNAARSCVNSIDQIIEVAFQNNNDFGNKVLKGCTKYQDAMKLLTSHRELSVEEIEHFQFLIDDFYEIWIEVFGSEGVTNYIHMLGSGHIMYFLKEYKCLYLYSQQGWEALNGKIQTFIHQNSQRGGHNSGTKQGEKSYIFSVVRMVIRDLLWKTYEADKFYLDLQRRGYKC
jgi:hypothetical protein